MADADPDDPTAPTRRVDPVPPTRKADPVSPTRHVTQVVGQDGRTRVFSGTQVERPAESPADTGTTQPRRPAAAPAAETGTHGRGALAAPLAWLTRKVGGALVGPAHELEYAIPAELRSRYRLLRQIGAGGEAVVYLAEPDRPGGADSPVALKVYRPGHDINRSLLDRLRARSTPSPYTPAVSGYGHARSSWGEDLAWEAQEYFALGSMRTLLDEAPLPEDRARDVVAAVAACLRHWQEDLQHNHTDVKPENLLIRKLDPPVFALTDFGGAVRATMSRVYGGLAITEAYAAPEVIEGRREAPAAWWSLGVTVHELMTGRRPHRGENWLTARSSEVDVSAIGDERWRLLARGLLTPVPESRWGYAEVNQWLAGEEPRVVKPRRHASLRFADVDHDDPPSLAFDLMDRSDKGAVWLTGHWQSLRTWLDREVNDYTFDRAYLTDLETRPERAHLAISALAASFVPGMPPRYRGYEVTAEGLLSLATGDGSRHAALREAVEAGALGLAARHWCDHPECRGGGSNRCARLERVQHEVPLVMTEVFSRVDRLSRESDSGVQAPADHAWDAAWAMAAELVLDDEAARRYRRTLRLHSWHPIRRSDARRAQWWRDLLRDDGRGSVGESAAVSAHAALVAAVLLLPSADRVGAVDRQLRSAERRQLWLERRERLSQGVSGALRRGEPEAADGGYRPHPGTPEDQRRRAERERKRREREGRRVTRGMRQIEKAMTAGRCRRFARPAALLGLLDGLGQLLLFSVGLSYPATWIANTDAVITAFSQSAVMGWIGEMMSELLGFIPGELGFMWGFPVVLAVLLFLCGRYAANQRRLARVRLTAYWLAAAGSAVMAVRLLSSGLYYTLLGILIPVSMIAG